MIDKTSQSDILPRRINKTFMTTTRQSMQTTKFQTAGLFMVVKISLLIK